MSKSIQLSTLIALTTLSLSSYAGPERIYKWVDNKGETHYGHTIPPEYADRDRFEIDKTGRIVKKTDVLTAEEHRAQEAAAAQQQVLREQERNKKLRDSSLLNTYSNVKEIDLARARNLQQVDARAQVAGKQLSNANDAYAALKVRADSLTKSGKPIPTYLREDLIAAQANVVKLNKEYAAINTEKSTLEARYDEDKARYKELTGKQQ